MRLTTTIPDYLALAAIDDDSRRAAAWTDTYEAAHPRVFATYHRRWGRHDRCLASVTDVPQQARTLPVVEARARRLAEHAERSFRAAGLIDDDLDVVLMVGGHTSNGWVTDLDGRDTVFLALEFLGDPPYDGVLVSHEALHVAHLRRGAGVWPEDGAASLFQEGLAVAVSRALHPGLPDSAYLWHDDAHDDWVDECAAMGPQLAARTLGLLDRAHDDPAVLALFTGGRGPAGLPARAGYWLGDIVVGSLLEETPGDELLEWDHATVRLAVADRLGEMVCG
jgi:hypothetical protein